MDKTAHRTQAMLNKQPLFALLHRNTYEEERIIWLTQLLVTIVTVAIVTVAASSRQLHLTKFE